MARPSSLVCDSSHPFSLSCPSLISRSHCCCYLGRGSFGEVLKASLESNPCAVKKIRFTAPTETSRRDFCGEVNLLYCLSHPNIINIMGAAICNKGTSGWLLMELLDHSLRTEIYDCPQVPTAFRYSCFFWAIHFVQSSFTPFPSSSNLFSSCRGLPTSFAGTLLLR